jgi:hypothetical protein
MRKGSVGVKERRSEDGEEDTIGIKFFSRVFSSCLANVKNKQESEKKRKRKEKENKNKNKLKGI